MFGTGIDRNEHINEFHELRQKFFSGRDEKYVDVSGGKHFVAVVTESGKLYASGYTFYRAFSSCRFNRQHDEDYPYELRLPEGYRKAFKVFGQEKRNNIWVNATDADGNMRTLGAGESEFMNARGRSDNNEKDRFKPIAVPEGTYMTQISCQGDSIFAVDQDANLWVWGCNLSHIAREDQEVLFDRADYGAEVRNDQPYKFKWFTE